MQKETNFFLQNKEDFFTKNSSSFNRRKLNWYIKFISSEKATKAVQALMGNTLIKDTLHVMLAEIKEEKIYASQKSF